MISVIIPIYNAASYLPYMLNCMEAQMEKDYELLLINDGSTDASGSICDAAASLDKRIRVFHRPNRGVSSARNLGLQEARGEYIVFLDADDEIGPEYLSVLLQTCRQTGCKIAVCDVVIMQDGIEKGRFTHEAAVVSRQMALNLLLTREKVNSGPSGKIFSRELCQTIQFPPLKAYEDILFIKDVFSEGDKIAITPQTEYRYIQNSTGAMSSFVKAPSEDIIIATEELAQFIKKDSTLSPGCMYITLSHLMQYVQPLLKSPDAASRTFVLKARDLYRRHIDSILKCRAFPWKEKIVFCAFALGII